MANSVTKAVVYNKLLDSVVQASLTSTPLTANSSRVQYNGGNSVKIAKLSVGGFGTYNRDTGYPAGAATLAWGTYEMTQDRGIKFNVDVMDEDETQGTLSAAYIIAEFGKNNEAPEVDAYRYSRIFQSVVDDSTVRYGYYTLAIATILSQFNTDVGAVRAACGRSVPLLAFMSESAFTSLSNSSQLTKNLETQMAGEFQIQTEVYSINGVKIIPVPDDRLKTEYAFSATNGFAAKAWAMDINWIIVSPEAVVAFSKHNKMKVIGADMNPDADADLVTARLYHDCWILENKHNMIYVNLKTATIAGFSAAELSTTGATNVTYTIATYATRDTGHKFYYYDGGTVAAIAAPAAYNEMDLTGYVEITSASAVADVVTSGYYGALLEIDENGRAVRFETLKAA